MRQTVFLLLISLIGCTNADPITGDWKRTGDIYEGSVIRIEKFGNAFQGVLISPNKKMKEYTFEAGEIYLKNLVCIEENRYKAEGLVKGYNGNNQTYFYTDILLELENKNFLVMKKYASDKNIVTGSQYKWIRLD